VKIPLKHNLWADERLLTLDLPEEWRTDVLRMAGDRAPLLTASAYQKALTGLAPLCKEKKEVCILFDDLSRPTRGYQIVPYLLEQLEQGGIRDEQVRFICALGTHGPLDNVAFRQKLGSEVLDRFPVYNHNPYENCDDLGKTALGTPILVNREYLSCDLRIAVGAFLPHSFCGYGGGYKSLLPGVAHLDSIAHHHGKLLKENTQVCVIGAYERNPLLDDVREFGARVGLDAKIDVMVNSGADNVAIYAGNPDGVYSAFSKKAQQHYMTRVPGKADIVFVNAFAKGNEATICLSLAEQLLKDEGGFIVLLSDAPQGQVVHYAMGRFGNDTWGRVGVGERKNSEKVKKILIFSRYKDLAGGFWLGKREDVAWFSDLNDIVKVLEDEYRGKIPVVHVIPDGTIQMASFAE
jgi:lactate racemase